MTHPQRKLGYPLLEIVALVAQEGIDSDEAQFALSAAHKLGSKAGNGCLGMVSGGVGI